MRLRVACVGAGTIAKLGNALRVVVLHDTDENALVTANRCIKGNFRSLKSVRRFKASLELVKMTKRILYLLNCAAAESS